MDRTEDAAPQAAEDPAQTKEFQDAVELAFLAAFVDLPGQSSTISGPTISRDEAVARRDARRAIEQVFRSRHATTGVVTGALPPLPDRSASSEATTVLPASDPSHAAPPPEPLPGPWRDGPPPGVTWVTEEERRARIWAMGDLLDPEPMAGTEHV
jgi:hypothetical protein